MRVQPLSLPVVGRLAQLAGLGLLAVAVLFCAGSNARNSVVILGHDWPKAEWLSIDDIKHDSWNSLLKRYVDGTGNVDYSRWKRSVADMHTLDAYLNALSCARPELPAGREARLAFWINAYNAVTVKGILRAYPTPSIQELAANRHNIWSDLLLKVGGTAYSLGQIENEVLRKMQEPRIHFAIVCAAHGCPRLLNEAYTTGKLEEQLNDNSKALFADPSKFYYDPARNQLYLSPIMKWYAEDFGATQAQQLKTIVPFLPQQSVRGLMRTDEPDVSYLDYDWSLNDRVDIERDGDGTGGVEQ